MAKNARAMFWSQSSPGRKPMVSQPSTRESALDGSQTCNSLHVNSYQIDVGLLPVPARKLRVKKGLWNVA